MSIDDEDFVSSSSQEAFTRADKGKLKKLKEQIGKDHGKHAESKANELQSQKDLLRLQTQLAGQKDEETRRLKEEQEEGDHQDFDFSTKTHEDMLDDDGMVTEEQLQKEAKEKEILDDQAGQEYQQQMG